MPDFGLTRAIRQAVMRGAREAKVLRPGQAAAEAADNAAVDAAVGAVPPPEVPAAVVPDNPAPLIDPATATPAPAAVAPGAVPAVPAAQPPSMLETLPPQADPGSPSIAGEARRVTGLKLTDYDLEATSQINFDQITTTDEVKAVIADVSARNAGRIDEARRGVITNEQLKGLANELGARESFVREVMTRREGGVLNAETILGARQVLTSSAQRIFDIGTKIKKGLATDIEKLQFRRQFMWHADFQTQFLGARAEAGRALNAFNIPVGAELDLAQIRDTVENMNGYDIERLADLAVMTNGDVGAMSKASRQYMQGRFLGTLNEIFINSILSGPATHIVNTTGSILFQGMNIAETALAARIGQTTEAIARVIPARLGRYLSSDEHVQVGEANALLAGTIGAYKDAFALAARTMRTGVALDDVIKFESTDGRRVISSERMLTPEQLATPVGQVAGAFIDVAGAVIRAPTERVMAPTDEFFKTLAYRAELQRLALLHVQDQLVKTPNLDLQTIEEMTKEFMENTPLKMEQAAVDYTRYVTFQNSLGPTGQHWQLALRHTPGAFLVAPFVRTPVNLFKAGIIDRSPLGVFSKKFWRTMRAGGRERDMMLARISMGTATTAVIASYAAEGLITGGGPQNPEQRRLLEASGWQPYSIKVTGPDGETRYHSYSRLEPLAFVIGATADAVEIGAYLDGAGMEDDENYVLHAATAVITGIMNNTTSKTFVKGLVDFNELMGDPGRYMEGWTRNAASGLVPYSSFRAEAGQLQDPYLREAWTVLDQLAIRSGIPGYSEDAPISRDVFGDPRQHPQGLILGTMSPFPAKIDAADRVTREVVNVMQASQTVPISMPGKTVGLGSNLGTIRLNAREYELLVRLSRKELILAGRTFKEELARTMESTVYSNSTDDMKSQLLRSVQTRYDDNARDELERIDPGFATRIARARDRANLRRGR